jgi:NAD(P)-dependent dehydrogenase (short-subunit alcohol dehydrogenase family)
MSMDLRNKVGKGPSKCCMSVTDLDQIAIITGASSGIGLEAATLFLKLNASVLGVDINAAPASLANKPNFNFYQTNLAKAGAADKVVEVCKNKYGDRIDVLLNIAGVMDTNNSVDTLEEAMWDRVIAINLTAPVMLCKAVIGTMLHQGSGSIVNVASKAGISGSAAGVAYTSSKHGIVCE